MSVEYQPQTSAGAFVTPFQYFSETVSIPKLADVFDKAAFNRRERTLKKMARELNYILIRDAFGTEYENATRIYDWMKQYWPNRFYEKPSIWKRLRLFCLQVFKPRER